MVGVLLLAVTTAGAEPLTGLKAAEPQPSAEQLAPGLAVGYVFGRFNHLNEFMNQKFSPGKPLPQLDYRMGDGAVLTTAARDLVGALITGFVRFDTAGTYGFNVTSNDGVRVEIGGKLLYEDPSVHSDDTTDRIDVKVEQPGWYPIKILVLREEGDRHARAALGAPGHRPQGQARSRPGRRLRLPQVGRRRPAPRRRDGHRWPFCQ